MAQRVVVGILVYPGVDELDVIGPYRVFHAVNEVRPHIPEEEVEAGEAMIYLVAEDWQPPQGTFGLPLPPTATYDDCPPLDVLLVPGGGSRMTEGGRRAEQRNEPTLRFVRAAAADARVTASVCTGAFLLAESGLLAGRRANTHWTARRELVELMAARGEAFTLETKRVVADGDLVTGGGVTSGIPIAFAVVERIWGPQVRRGVELALEAETPGTRTAAAAAPNAQT